MLSVNIYIELIRVCMNKHWNILSIQGSQINRDIAIAFLGRYHCGVQEINGNSDIYFENPDKENIEKVINKKTSIKQWNWTKVEKKNWNENWKPFFKDILISEKIKIIPSWSEENIEDNKNKILIKIEPGMAFGTGHHETTSMMIEALCRYFKKGNTIMDIGAGSGILSILAKKLGANQVYAIDNDDETISNFEYNKKINDILIDLEITDCLNLNNFNYDILLANINKVVLTKLIPRINSKGNLIIISGILITDYNDIENILNQNRFEIVEKLQKNEWMCLITRKN